MKLRQFAQVTRESIITAADGVVRFAKLEHFLSAFFLMTPAFLIWFDNGNIRPSIS